MTGGISFAGGYPLDSVSATYPGAFGVGALTSTWKTGNLFDVITPGTGDVVTIKAIDPGYPDVRTLASVLGVNPRTGIGGAAVSKWYHQKGGTDVTQTDTANGKRPMVWLIAGKVYIDFDGALNTAIAHAFFNGTIAFNTQSVSMFAAINPFTSSNSLNVMARMAPTRRWLMEDRFAARQVRGHRARDSEGPVLCRAAIGRPGDRGKGIQALSETGRTSRANG